MALTLTPAGLSAAIRLGDSPEETAEATRLLGYVTAAITQHLGTSFEGAPEAVVDEAAIRLGAYLFDMPNAGRGLSYANAGRNSGAWTILLPYRIHRAGSTGGAVSAAQEAVGTTGNPVTGLAITVDGKLEVIFADGATVELDLPAGMGGGVLDQTARDSAAAAQTAADGATTSAANAQADIDAHKANHPSGGAGVDQAARDAAAAAQSDIDAHEASTHNTDGTARTAAANAQSAIEDHERTTHNTDTTARDAAAAAQSDADTAQTTAGQAQATATAASTAANAARADIDSHEANHPTGMGGGEGAGLEVSTAEIRFLRSTPLVEIDSQQFTNAVWSNLQRDGADVVCPNTGQLEFFMHAKTGGRDNSVAYAKIPAAELRATPTDGEMQVALGANRWFGIRTNSLADQHIQLKGQDGQTSVDGTYSVRISHIEEVAETFVTGITGGGGA